MKSTLKKIAEIIKEYKQTDVFDGNSLNKQLKELTAYLYYIETIRTKHIKTMKRLYMTESKRVFL